MGTKTLGLLIVFLTLAAACSESSHRDDESYCLTYSYDNGLGKGGGQFYVYGEPGEEMCNKTTSDESGKILTRATNSAPGLCKDLIEKFNESNIKKTNDLEHVMELVDRENNEIVWNGVFRASDASGFLDELKSRCPR